jgi:hypothetical protein
MPELTTYFQAGGLVDSVINQGLPAPIDVQVSSNDMQSAFELPRRYRKDQGLPQRERSVHPPGSGLSGAGAEYRPRARQPYRPFGKGCGGQRDYGPHLRRHGCADLLDRSQDWQQLHGDSAVRQSCPQSHDDGGLRKHSSAGTRPTGYGPAEEGRGSERYGRHTRGAILRCGRWPRSNRSIRLQKSTITRFAG